MMSINCHEVIPAPVDYGPPVQLDCEFTGQIMGSSDTVMVQMNDGSITCTSTSVKNIVTNGVSEARYSSLITSPNTGEQLTLNIGAVNWVGGNTPDTAAFLSFFSQDSTRLFDNTTAAGVSMIFRDSVGNFWTSQDTVVTFTNSFRYT